MAYSNSSSVGAGGGIFFLILIVAIGYGGWKLWGYLSEMNAQAEAAQQAHWATVQARELSFDEQLELKKQCADAGLTVKENKERAGYSHYVTTGITCGIPIAQRQADNLDPGMTTGEGVAAGAAVMGGAYLLGKMLE